MPHQDIDWAGLRANAVAIGVREAARQVGADLPPIERNRLVMRVLQRSHREGWLRRKTEVMERVSPSSPTNTNGQVKPMTAQVITSSDAMANHLKTIKNRSRFALGKFVLNASKVASKSRKPLAIAGQVRDIAATYSTLYPEERTAGALTLNVGVAIGGME